ncbi:MAG: endonuclease III [Hyphomicrobium aestuarii]|nr:endonuclease III [Hyphomicrobium aestuarii]
MTAQTSAKPRASARKRSKTPNARRRSRFSKDVAAAIFAEFARANPNPQGELEHVNAYTLLVAVVLSAQSTDAGVNKATRPLFAVADTPPRMVALGEDGVREAIKTIGLYRNKAKNVIALSEQLIAEHNGEVPRDRAALERLPGVGRKTANVVLNMAFGEPTMAVDTHVFRVSHRIGFSKAKTPDGVEHDVLDLVAPEYGLHAHHWLILHGRYLCKARKPECWRCTISQHCNFKRKEAAPQ